MNTICFNKIWMVCDFEYTLLIYIFVTATWWDKQELVVPNWSLSGMFTAVCLHEASCTVLFPRSVSGFLDVFPITKIPTLIRLHQWKITRYWRWGISVYLDDAKVHSRCRNIFFNTDDENIRRRNRNISTEG